MAVFLERFARELAPGVHAALVLDRAGWHVARRLAVPGNVTLVPLPPYSPELNPVERVWLYLRERFLSHRVLDGYEANDTATTAAMNLFLAEFGRGLPEDVHAALVLDGAGWHGAEALAVPANVTLVPLPPYSPELNPVERVWLYLRERFLSLRVFADYHAIVDACCLAWNRLVADPGRLRSLCDQPWITNVSLLC